MREVTENLLFYGEAKTSKVWFGEKELRSAKTISSKNKSAPGFAWGYYGAGPAQLAMTILLELTDVETALRLYQEFKAEVIATYPTDEDMVLPTARILEWLCGKQANSTKKLQN